MPLQSQIKLCGICYKVDKSRQQPTAIQLLFTVGLCNFFASPLYEANNKNSTPLVRRGIDVSKKIAKVMVYVKFGEMLTALKMIDCEGKILMQLDWGLIEQGEWVSQVIPDGKEIIGMYCRTEYMTIEKLGFIVWTPNQNALETYNGKSEELGQQ